MYGLGDGWTGCRVVLVWKGTRMPERACEAVEEGGVEGEAEVGEWMERRGVVGIVCGEHSGGGGGGFGEGSGAVEDGDAGAAVVEFEGEGEADDAGSGDADVGVVHGTSLDGGGEVIVWCIWVARPREGLGAGGLCQDVRLTIDGTRRME